MVSMAPIKKTSKSQKLTLTDEHKAALAAGRVEGRAVRNYLEALDANKPSRGRQRTPESIQARLDEIDVEIGAAAPTKRLTLIQERLDLNDRLAQHSEPVDLSELEAEFVASAASYAARKGISYTAFREVGVPASVLRDAGIARTR